MKYRLEDIMHDLKETAITAGHLMKNKTAESLYTREKSSFKDLVTVMDTKIQAFAINSIKEKYSEACFICEEMNNNEESLFSELVFVIDPIDGTANFVKGMNYSSISIGCLLNGEPVAGVVYNPYSDELFSAIKGCGAYLNDAAIKVSSADIHESLILFGTSPYDADTTDDTFVKLENIYIKCLDIRRFGSAALDICSVACGRAGLYFESRLSLWDYVAAYVVLSEAGGELCNYKGEKIGISLEKTSVIAGSKPIIEQSELLKEG